MTDLSDFISLRHKLIEVSRTAEKVKLKMEKTRSVGDEGRPNGAPRGWQLSEDGGSRSITSFSLRRFQRLDSSAFITVWSRTRNSGPFALCTTRTPPKLSSNFNGASGATSRSGAE